MDIAETVCKYLNAGFCDLWEIAKTQIFYTRVGETSVLTVKVCLIWITGTTVWFAVA